MTGDNSWLIRGVTIPGRDEKATSILITGGSVTAIGPDLDHPGARILDAGGLIALPGLVDLHTHLREPGREDAETVETGTAQVRVQVDEAGQGDQAAGVEDSGCLLYTSPSPRD